ncbi:MAG: putative motility protein [Chloroflexi bacterium]|nr:putative motility protein [Chloroflexota bacterium]MBV9895630.1 putative motility protein [Chloroflexota bacterium]
MDSASSAAQAGGAAGVAVQKLMLDSMKTTGAKLTNMLDAAGAPQGSVNSASQGTHVDAWA